MNFQSWQSILLFKLDLNQFELGFDYGADTWRDLIGAGFCRVDNADCAQSTADLGR